MKYIYLREFESLAEDLATFPFDRVGPERLSRKTPNADQKVRNSQLFRV